MLTEAQARLQDRRAEDTADAALIASRQFMGAFRNRAFGNFAAGPTAPANSTNAIICTCSTVVRASGVFLASINLNWAGATNGQLETWTLTTQTGTGALAMTNIVSMGTTPPGLSSPYGAQTSNNTAGITITTGGGGSLTQSTIVQPAVTGAVQDQLSWTNYIHNSVSNTSEVPFTKGNNVIFILSGPNCAGSAAMTYTNLSVTLQELP